MTMTPTENAPERIQQLWTEPPAAQASEPRERFPRRPSRKGAFALVISAVTLALVVDLAAIVGWLRAARLAMTATGLQKLVVTANRVAAKFNRSRDTCVLTSFALDNVLQRLGFDLSGV